MLIVFGSINMDVRVQVNKLPRPGETILSPGYDMSPGGKGANQALASARTGVKTALVGMVGDDGPSQRILNNLRRNEVMTSGVGTSDNLPTGMAFVTTDAEGENHIVVAQGANAAATAEQVPDEILKPGNVVLLQMEVPLAENINVMERAKKRGSTVILNLAPAFHITEKALMFSDYLIVNEQEARTIAEMIGMKTQQDLMLIAKALSALGQLTCVITLGAEGSLAMQEDGKGWRVPALKLDQVIDTTGAGDCYCGTFAACIHNKYALASAMRRASVTASLSCKVMGTQEAYPYSADVEAVLEDFPQAQPCV